MESAADGPAQPPPADNTETSLPRNKRPRAEVEQEPLIKRAMDVLEARFIREDEGFGATPAVSAERTEAADGEES
jgi:hypothetical protein